MCSEINNNILEIRNDVFHSGTMKMSSDCFNQYVVQMKAVLKLDIFEDYKAAKDGLKKAEISKEEKQVTIEDEMSAREDIIAAIKELKKLKKKNKDNNDSIRQEIAHLTSVEDQHNRELQKLFHEVQSHMQGLQEEYIHTRKKLDEHKCILDRLHDTLSSPNEQLSCISGILQEANKTVLKENETIKAVLEKIERACAAIANPSINQIPFKDIKLTLVINMNDKDETMMSAYVVESANGIKPHEPRTQVQQCLETALKSLTEGFDVQIHKITHECVAIHLGFPTLKSWLEFLHGYFNGDIGNIFLPLQEHLRTYLGFEDLELIVVVYEEDFIKCSLAISLELESFSCGKIPHLENKEEKKISLVHVEETTHITAHENTGIRKEHTPHKRETPSPDTSPQNEPAKTIKGVSHYKEKLELKPALNYKQQTVIRTDSVEYADGKTGELKTPRTSQNKPDQTMKCVRYYETKVEHKPKQNYKTHTFSLSYRAGELKTRSRATASQNKPYQPVQGLNYRPQNESRTDSGYYSRRSTPSSYGDNHSLKETPSNDPDFSFPGLQYEEVKLQIEPPSKHTKVCTIL